MVPQHPIHRPPGRRARLELKLVRSRVYVQRLHVVVHLAQVHHPGASVRLLSQGDLLSRHFHDIVIWETLWQRATQRQSIKGAVGRMASYARGANKHGGSGTKTVSNG